MNIVVKGAVICAAFLVFASPSLAGDLTPIGEWQTTSGESRYEISQCGNGNLCAKLIWLRSDARTEENLQYLNKNIVDGARRTGANRWKGDVQYGGDVFGGSMTLVSPEKLKLKGCKAIFCQSVEFVRL